MKDKNEVRKVKETYLPVLVYSEDYRPLPTFHNRPAVNLLVVAGMLPSGKQHSACMVLR
jgi:hypothetical protein